MPRKPNLLNVPDKLDESIVNKRLKPVVDKLEGDTKKTAQKLCEKLRDALKKLPAGLDNSAFDNLDSGLRFDSAAHAKSVLASLESAKVKETAGQLKSRHGDVKEYAEELRDLLGKDRSVADAVKALSELVVDGYSWALAAERCVTQGMERISNEQKKLGDQESGARASGSPEVNRMIGRTRTALKEIRSGGGEVTIPFLAADCRSDIFIYVARDAIGGGAEQRVRDALGEDGKGATMIRGDCGLLNRKIFFASPKLSGGTFAVRIQRRLQADIGQRLPIAVGTDRSALETVDADDFDDPLDFLIAQRGPLASRAQSCKTKRQAIFRELEREGILDAGGTTARQAQDLLDRADTAAENADLTDFERAIDAIRNDVIAAHRRLKDRAERDKREFETAFAKFKPDLEALRKDVMDRVKEVTAAAKEGVLEKEAPDAAEKRRRDLRSSSQEFDTVYSRIQRAGARAWADDLYADAKAAMTKLQEVVTKMNDELKRDRDAEKEARRRKEKEDKKSSGSKSKDDEK